MVYIPLFLSADSAGFAFSADSFLRFMGIVFIVLIAIWGIVKICKNASAGDSESAVTGESAPSSVALAKEHDNEATDPAIVAAIMAAVEAYRAEEGLSNLAYRVVSFKRKNGNRPWTNGN